MVVSRTFRDVEHDSIVTDVDLFNEWQGDKILEAEYPRFSWYVNACLVENGGVLEELF